MGWQTQGKFDQLHNFLSWDKLKCVGLRINNLLALGLKMLWDIHYCTVLHA